MAVIDYEKVAFKRVTEICPDSIIELMNDPAVRRHLPLARSHFGVSECGSFVAAKERMWKESGFGPWASGGLTAWELACLGVPNVIVSTAEGERQTGLVLHGRGYVHYVGHYDEVSSVELAQDIQLLDLLLNLGARSLEIIRSGGRPLYTSEEARRIPSTERSENV